MKLFKALALLALMAGLITGCKTTLQPGGSYAPTNAVNGVTPAPDLAFYQVDMAFNTAYSIVDGIFNWERDNRAALWKISPEIKHTLDKARPTAADVARNYFLARAAYKKSPTPDGLKGLQSWLAKIQQVNTAVSAVSVNLNPK